MNTNFYFHSKNNTVSIYKKIFSIILLECIISIFTIEILEIGSAITNICYQHSNKSVIADVGTPDATLRVIFLKFQRRHNLNQSVLQLRQCRWLWIAEGGRQTTMPDDRNIEEKNEKERKREKVTEREERREER